jgi:hypothetical protein
VVGCGCDRCGAIGAVLHAERVENVSLEHRIPIGCAFRFRNDATGKDVGNVGVGEGRAET